MRTCIFALAAVVPVFAIGRAGAADEPPAFDIAQYCRELVGVTSMAESCTKDETAAKNELTDRWSQFGASEKKSCIDEAIIGSDSDKSYFGLLTCLVDTTDNPALKREEVEE